MACWKYSRHCGPHWSSETSWMNTTSRRSTPMRSGCPRWSGVRRRPNNPARACWAARRRRAWRFPAGWPAAAGARPGAQDVLVTRLATQQAPEALLGEARAVVRRHVVIAKAGVPGGIEGGVRSFFAERMEHVAQRCAAETDAWQGDTHGVLLRMQMVPTGVGVAHRRSARRWMFRQCDGMAAVQPVAPRLPQLRRFR